MNPEIRWKQRFDNCRRAGALLGAALERGPAALSPLGKEGAAGRFEYSYELAWKTLEDYLEEGGMVLPQVTPRQVINEAFAAFRLAPLRGYIERVGMRIYPP